MGLGISSLVLLILNSAIGVDHFAAQCQNSLNDIPELQDTLEVHSKKVYSKRVK